MATGTIITQNKAYVTDNTDNVVWNANNFFGNSNNTWNLYKLTVVDSTGYQEIIDIKFKKGIDLNATNRFNPCLISISASNANGTLVFSGGTAPYKMKFEME